MEVEGSNPFARSSRQGPKRADHVPPIPLTISIANGLAFGLTAYALIKLVRGKIAWTGWLLLVISALFVARFVWLSAGN